MERLWAVLRWWLVILVISLAGIGLILAWDWFFWRRLPWARWRVSELSPRETSILREVLRVRRLKPRGTPPDAPPGDGRP